MADKFEVHVEAERLIHNELGSVAHHLKETLTKKIASGDREGVGLEMIACLIFLAFEFEAKVNFVGWKLLEDEWNERAALEKKTNRLCNELKMGTDWDQRPLSTIHTLKSFRDTLAHGKPEVVNEKFVTDVEPQIWEALKGQWEETVTLEFVNQADEDAESLWRQMLEKAGIEIHETITAGGHSLSKLVD